MDPHWLDNIPVEPPPNKCVVGFYKRIQGTGLPKLETALITHGSVFIGAQYYTYEDAKTLSGKWWSEWATSPDLPLPPE